jgi:hypothetical protein
MKQKRFNHDSDFSIDDFFNDIPMAMIERHRHFQQYFPIITALPVTISTPTSTAPTVQVFRMTTVDVFCLLVSVECPVFQRLFRTDS